MKKKNKEKGFMLILALVTLAFLCVVSQNMMRGTSDMAKLLTEIENQQIEKNKQLKLQK